MYEKSQVSYLLSVYIPFLIDNKIVNNQWETSAVEVKTEQVFEY